MIFYLCQRPWKQPPWLLLYLIQSSRTLWCTCKSVYCHIPVQVYAVIYLYIHCHICTSTIKTVNKCMYYTAKDLYTAINLYKCTFQTERKEDINFLNHQLIFHFSHSLQMHLWRNGRTLNMRKERNQQIFHSWNHQKTSINPYPIGMSVVPMMAHPTRIPCTLWLPYDSPVAQQSFINKCNT